MTHLLFVYGTLREDAGSPWHNRLIAPNCSFIGKATTAGRLVHLGEYPGLLPATNCSQRVTGEVWQLINPAALAAMDEYEGPEYCRRKQKIRLEDGRMMKAWAYLYTGPLTHAGLMQSGDYLRP